MTTAALNTKIKEVYSKIPVVSGLVKKTDHDTKISEFEGKYFPTSDDIKFSNDIVDATIKQKDLVNKSVISNLTKDSDLNVKFTTLATEAELKAE